MSEVITDHEAVGMPITYDKVKGKVIAVKLGTQLRYTPIEGGMDIKPHSTIAYKIQPNDGGKCIWTPECTLAETEAK